MKKNIIIMLLLSSTLLMANVKLQSMPGNPKRENASNTNVILSYHNSIKKVQNIVVNIASTKKLEMNENFQNMLNNPFLKEFFGDQFRQMKKQRRKAYSLGSGVIISQDGYIVTNNHVVNGADKIIVTVHGDKKEYKAKIIGQDPKTDIAVIKIDAKNLPVAQFGDSSKLLTGDIVFAVGNPFGVGESVTQGIISALNKSSIGLNQYENFIQTDASINPGNSGGALVDSRGAIIGINSAIISRSGGNNGIGFAIPSNMVKKIAITLINDGKVQRGYLGVSITDLKADMKDLYKSDSGALILTVEKKSSAEKAGLQRGDLIIEVDGEKVKNANDLKNIVGSILPNKKITIKFERNKIIKTTQAILSNMNNSSNFSNNQEDPYIKGLTVLNIDQKLRLKYQIPKSISGVLITKVKYNSKADKIGFKRGDIIIQIQNQPITDIKSLNKTLQKFKNKTKMIYINRNGFVTYLIAK